jgi:hypothetical protein
VEEINMEAVMTLQFIVMFIVLFPIVYVFVKFASWLADLVSKDLDKEKEELLNEKAKLMSELLENRNKKIENDKLILSTLYGIIERARIEGDGPLSRDTIDEMDVVIEYGKFWEDYDAYSAE